LDRGSLIVLHNEPLLRDLICQHLTGLGFTVSAVQSAQQAIDAFELRRPHAVIMEILHDADTVCLAFADYLREHAPEMGVVFLTELPDLRFAGLDKSLLPANFAYLHPSKLSGMDDLVEAIELSIRNRPSIKNRHDLSHARPLSNLSRKQIGVLAMVAKGHTNHQIADSRGTTVRAVEGIIGRIFEALELDASNHGNARVEITRIYLKAMAGVAVEPRDRENSRELPELNSGLPE
jgi:DNA-binding NarL/FixJ family response regulator